MYIHVHHDEFMSLYVHVTDMYIDVDICMYIDVDICMDTASGILTP